MKLTFTVNGKIVEINLDNGIQDLYTLKYKGIININTQQCGRSFVFDYIQCKQMLEKTNENIFALIMDNDRTTFNLFNNKIAIHITQEECYDFEHKDPDDDDLGHCAELVKHLVVFIHMDKINEYDKKEMMLIGNDNKRMRLWKAYNAWEMIDGDNSFIPEILAGAVIEVKENVLKISKIYEIEQEQ